MATPEQAAQKLINDLEGRDGTDAKTVEVGDVKVEKHSPKEMIEAAMMADSYNAAKNGIVKAKVRFDD